jgi:HrpA-like RNA helicase
MKFNNESQFIPKETIDIEQKVERKIGNHDLPIWEKMPEIIETLKNNNRLILVSETGSGKTTQVPQALWEAGFTENGKIFIVENRVAVAVEIAKRVSEEMKVNIGDEVGYITGPEKASKK